MIHGHHHHEETIFFPVYKEKLSSVGFPALNEELEKEHRSLDALLTSIKKILDQEGPYSD